MGNGVMRARHWAAATIGVGISCLMAVLAEMSTVNYQLSGPGYRLGDGPVHLQQLSVSENLGG